jgi:hypothetical protein
MLISVDYFTGPGHVRRDIAYKADLTDAIQINANNRLLPQVNLLIAELVAAGVAVVIDPSTGSFIHSGWRPPMVNAATPGAAVKSNHLIGLAVDLYDPTGALDAWCQKEAGPGGRLEALGLWMEDPGSTLGWCHVQVVPFGSWLPGHLRVFKVK